MKRGRRRLWKPRGKERRGEKRGSTSGWEEEDREKQIKPNRQAGLTRFPEGRWYLGGGKKKKENELGCSRSGLEKRKKKEKNLKKTRALGS